MNPYHQKHVLTLHPSHKWNGSIPPDQIYQSVFQPPQISEAVREKGKIFKGVLRVQNKLNCVLSIITENHIDRNVLTLFVMSNASHLW